MTSKSEKFSLFNSFDSSKRHLTNGPRSARKRPEGVGRVVTLCDGTQTTQVLSDAQLRVERKKRGRLPHGFGTAAWRDGMKRHEQMKAKHRAEREARAEAIAERTALTDEQRAFVDKQLAILNGAEVDMRGRLLEPEAAH